MEHIEANVKIYFTRDYSRFSNISGNRMLNSHKIDKIIKDIEAGFDMLRYCPIIVDKDMNVIDGQHRLHVARKIKSNIWYLITDTLSLYEIAKLNSNTDKWKAQDFLTCYVILKNTNYIVLQEFIDEHHLSLSVALVLLESGKVRDSGAQTKVKENFQAGSFVVNHLAKAKELMAVADRFTDFPNRKRRPFLEAIDKLMAGGKCDMDHLIKKFNSSPDGLDQCSDAKSYLTAFEEIYNKHSQSRKVIY